MGYLGVVASVGLTNPLSNIFHVFLCDMSNSQSSLAMYTLNMEIGQVDRKNFTYFTIDRCYLQIFCKGRNGFLHHFLATGWIPGSGKKFSSLYEGLLTTNSHVFQINSMDGLSYYCSGHFNNIFNIINNHHLFKYHKTNQQLFSKIIKVRLFFGMRDANSFQILLWASHDGKLVYYGFATDNLLSLTTA